MCSKMDTVNCRGTIQTDRQWYIHMQHMLEQSENKC